MASGRELVYFLALRDVKVRLSLTRRVVDLPAPTLYAEVEDPQGRRTAV
jgi:hypothetical protein